MTLSSRFLTCAFLVAACANALPAQQPATRSQFIVKKGKDTVAMEIFSRDATTLTSEVYQSNGVRTQYTLDLRPDSSMRHVEMTRQGRQGGAGTVSVTFGDTLVTATFSAGSDAEKFEFAPHGKAVPFLVASFALAEQIVFASHLAAGKSQTLVAVRLGAGDSTTLTVSRFHADSVSFTMADIQLKLALSAKGEVIGGRNLGQDWIVERKPAKSTP